MARPLDITVMVLATLALISSQTAANAVTTSDPTGPDVGPTPRPGVFCRLGDGGDPAKPIFPAYSSMAIEQGAAGTAVIDIRERQFLFARSAGNPLLDQAALAAARLQQQADENAGCYVSADHLYEARYIAQVPCGAPREARATGPAVVPDIPEQAMKNFDHGTTRFMLLVGVDGLPEIISILQSSGSPLLDRSALQVVSQTHFQPATNGCTAVSSISIFWIEFRRN